MKVKCVNNVGFEKILEIGKVYRVKEITDAFGGKWYIPKNDTEPMASFRFVPLSSSRFVPEPAREKTLSECSYEELAKEMWKRCAEV